MLPIKRHKEILDILGRESAATVRAMAKQLKVTDSTIRRDLEVLEESGLVKRSHGGAMLAAEPRTQDLPFLDRPIIQWEEKDRIGQAAAALVTDKDSIFLDSGTTTECIVPYLLDRKGLTVVTCGLNIAVRLSASPDITTIVIGGELHVPTLSFVGLLNQKAIELYDLCFTKAFIGARGVSAKNGITNNIVERIPMKRIAMQCASEVMVVADGSKVGKMALWQITPVTAINHLITNESAPREERDAIAALGVTVTVV